MKWTKQLPTKPGIYLRRNPPASSVVREDLFLIGEDLCTGHAGKGLSALRLKDWHGAKRFWWFGPIPPYPKDDEND